jgi:signal peptidase I
VAPNPDAPPESKSDRFPPPSGPTAPSARRGGIVGWIMASAVVGWILVLVVALVAAFLIRTFVAQTFFIPSGSMEPTLQIGDRIIVDKLAYDLHPVERGDIVVFARPPTEDCGGAPVPDLVKRVIGLPGERISSEGNTVLINGRPLAEPWLPAGTQLGQPIQPQTVPAGDYFVMGDNRSDSCDSRDWGPLNGSLIVGHADVRIWPLSRLGNLGLGAAALWALVAVLAVIAALVLFGALRRNRHPPRGP